MPFELIDKLNSLSPLGLAGGLVYIIYLQLRNKNTQEAIKNNHLHGLPDMGETLIRMEKLLQNVNDNIIHIKARVNGKI